MRALPPPTDELTAMSTSPAAPAGSVLFIHGLYMTGDCWAGWEQRFQAAGYQTAAPSWPGRDGKPADLRAAPPAALNSLSFDQVVAINRQAAAALPAPLTLVGHSMGGLIAQLLLAEGVGQAAVAIDSAPPKGVTALSWSFLKSNAPALFGKGPIVLTAAQFHYAFLNHLDATAAAAIYDQRVVPEARGVANGPLTNSAAIDWAKARGPLLLVSGGADHIIPAALNAKNAAKYKASAGRTDLRDYPERTHWTLAQDGWEQVADDVLAWVGGT